jgi:cytochrome c2
MKKLLILGIVASTFFAACGGDSGQAGTDSSAETSASVSDYDPNRGEGKFDHVDLGDGLNKAMADAGKSTSEMKCLSCHKLTDEKLVGPGWAGVTERHKPEWIMNFMTNTDAMIDKDPKVQAMLEICLVRMPNQNLTDEEARSILEFMRENDGVK